MRKETATGVLWFIATLQAASSLICLYGLYQLNLVSNDFPLPSGKETLFWKNLALIGFLGSLLYFGRKTYSYLITEKIWQANQELVGEIGVSEQEMLERKRAKRAGYYLYLTYRPISGLIIGPLLGFIILGGLATIGRENETRNLELSAAGVFLSYVLAFLGGYTSSDVFDKFSKVGSRLSSRITDQIG